MSIFKTAVIAVLIFAGIVAFIVVATYISSCGRVATTPARVINRIVDEDNVIQNYEWYHDAYQKCLAYDQQLVNAIAAYNSHVTIMDSKSWTDKQEASRLNTVVLGIRNQRIDLVKKYNSRSGQLTRNKFKGWSLPYNLEVVEDTTVEVSE